MPLLDVSCWLAQFSMISVTLRGLHRGFEVRVAQVSIMVAIQLLVYDFVKQLCGIPPTGLH